MKKYYFQERPDRPDQPDKPNEPDKPVDPRPFDPDPSPGDPIVDPADEPMLCSSSISLRHKFQDMNSKKAIDLLVEMTCSSNADLAGNELLDIISNAPIKKGSLSLICFALLKYASVLLMLASIQRLTKQ